MVSDAWRLARRGGQQRRHGAAAGGNSVAAMACCSSSRGGDLLRQRRQGSEISRPCPSSSRRPRRRAPTPRALREIPPALFLPGCASAPPGALPSRRWRISKASSGTPVTTSSSIVPVDDLKRRSDDDGLLPQPPQQHDVPVDLLLLAPPRACIWFAFLISIREVTWLSIIRYHGEAFDEGRS
ncbi:hypothetical protein EJB05_29924, partial [Eragrostis curvula]